MSEQKERSYPTCLNYTNIFRKSLLSMIRKSTSRLTLSSNSTLQWSIQGFNLREVQMVKNGHFHISENSTYSVGRLRKKKSNPTFLNVRNVFQSHDNQLWASKLNFYLRHLGLNMLLGHGVQKLGGGMINEQQWEINRSQPKLSS